MDLRKLLRRQKINNILLNTDNLKDVLGNSDDIIFSNFQIGANRGIHITILYVDGMVDIGLINDFILKPLITSDQFRDVKNSKELVELVEKGGLYFASHTLVKDIDDCLNEVIMGNVAVILDNINTAITFDVKGFDKRSITEPSGENVLKGAKDTFIEVLRTNTALIRRKISTPKLRIKQLVVGRQTLTHIAIVYIEGLTDEDLIEEVIRRVDSLDIDEVISAGYIEEYIIDNKITAFPLIDSTERTDKFCANIISGRVGLIIDGLPKGYIIPGVLNQFLQAPEDYAQNYIVSSTIRFMRFSLMILTLILPALYVSLTTFHQEMIPTRLAISIAASKRGVPFPSFVEVIIMLIAFEILIEAGIRLPRTIGNAVSILGALVVGEAAVSAKIVSPGVVIIVALAGISTFTMPNQDLSNALRLWRFSLTIFGSISGLFGLTIGSLLLLLHLCSIETFGIPYLSPFVSHDGFSYMDTIFRFPLYLNKYRPKDLKTQNKRKQR